MSVIDDKARLSNFHDPSMPHPPKPNEIECMNIAHSTGVVHGIPVILEKAPVLSDSSTE